MSDSRVFGLRRRDDRLLMIFAGVIFTAGLSAILAAVVLRIQVQKDAEVAAEVRQMGKQLSAIFASSALCTKSADRTVPIALAQSETSEGAEIRIAFPDGRVLGDGLLVRGESVVFSGLRFSRSTLIGQTTTGLDVYVGELTLDYQKSGKGEPMESSSIGRVAILTQKNVFQTHTIQGCRAHTTEFHEAQLCAMMGGSFDRQERACLARCPSYNVTIASGHSFDIPPSPSGAVRNLIAEGAVQASALCTNGAWMLVDERMPDLVAQNQGPNSDSQRRAAVGMPMSNVR